MKMYQCRIIGESTLSQTKVNIENDTKFYDISTNPGCKYPEHEAGCT